MPESAKPSIAVIGLGSMGFGMATSLKRAGFGLTGCDGSADSVARFVADGGSGARTPAEAAKATDIVVSVVVNAAQTETIRFGAHGATGPRRQGRGVHLLGDDGSGCGAAAGEATGGHRPVVSGRADLRRCAARGAGRTHYTCSRPR